MEDSATDDYQIHLGASVDRKAHGFAFDKRKEQGRMVEQQGVLLEDLSRECSKENKNPVLMGE